MDIIDYCNNHSLGYLDIVLLVIMTKLIVTLRFSSIVCNTAFLLLAVLCVIQLSSTCVALCCYIDYIHPWMPKAAADAIEALSLIIFILLVIGGTLLLLLPWPEINEERPIRHVLQCI
jgi:hypothetical protein